MTWILLLIGTFIFFAAIFYRFRKRDLAYLKKNIAQTAGPQIVNEMVTEQEALNLRKKKFATALEKAGKGMSQG